MTHMSRRAASSMANRMNSIILSLSHPMLRGNPARGWITKAWTPWAWKSSNWRTISVSDKSSFQNQNGACENSRGGSNHACDSEEVASIEPVGHELILQPVRVGSDPRCLSMQIDYDKTRPSQHKQAPKPHFDTRFLSNGAGWGHELFGCVARRIYSPSILEAAVQK